MRLCLSWFYRHLEKHKLPVQNPPDDEVILIHVPVFSYCQIDIFYLANRINYLVFDFTCVGGCNVYGCDTRNSSVCILVLLL